MNKYQKLYRDIRELEYLLDFYDDLIAHKDHVIYLLQKGINLNELPKCYKHKRYIRTVPNKGLDLNKFFQIKYDIELDSVEASTKFRKVLKDLKFELAGKKELFLIREQEVNNLMGQRGAKKQCIKLCIFKMKKMWRILCIKGPRILFISIFKKCRLSFSKSPQLSPSSSKQKIAYVVNALAISGGMQIVIRHAMELMKRGYEVSIISLSEYESSDWLRIEIPVFFVENLTEGFIENLDILVATHWSTVPYVDLSLAKRKIYFVQSDERRFILEKSCKENLINYIEETYKADLEFMTEAIWIQKWLNSEFNKDAYYVPNGLDTKIFHKVKPIQPKSKRLRILIEGQINYWLKGMEEAYEAVKDLDCELWILSSWGKPPKHWKYDKFFERVPFEEMKTIYSSCDIFLKMSKVEGFFGPPMEAMTCGCAVVVSKVTGYDEYIKNGINALVVDSGDVLGAKKCVLKLMGNDKLRKNLIKNGLQTAKDWDWNKSIDLLEKVVKADGVKKFYTSNFPENYNFVDEREKIEEYLKRRESYLFGIS